MKCSTIRTPDIGHICKHDPKFDQLQWSTPSAVLANQKRISENLNFSEQNHFMKGALHKI